MKSLTQLIDTVDPAWPMVKDWIGCATRPIEILPASAARDDVLLATQVTTRSPLGAIIYETGGILVDHGWLRILGSGHPRLKRNIADWNIGKSSGFYLVADDAAGGFFALNGGAFGSDIHMMYYFAPDTLRWQPLNESFSTFCEWAFTGNLDEFYKGLKWTDWEVTVAKIDSDTCVMIYPPLWTTEGRTSNVSRSLIAMEEAWLVQLEFKKQLDGL